MPDRVLTSYVVGFYFIWIYSDLTTPLCLCFCLLSVLAGMFVLWRQASDRWAKGCTRILLCYRFTPSLHFVRIINSAKRRHPPRSRPWQHPEIKDCYGSLLHGISCRTTPRAPEERRRPPQQNIFCFTLSSFLSLCRWHSNHFKQQRPNRGRKHIFFCTYLTLRRP